MALQKSFAPPCAYTEIHCGHWQLLKYQFCAQVSHLKLPNTESHQDIPSRLSQTYNISTSLGGKMVYLLT